MQWLYRLAARRPGLSNESRKPGISLTTYASSVRAGIPRSETTIRWAMKTAPRRKAIPAAAEDVVTGANPKLRQPLAQGHRGRLAWGVDYSGPEKAPADALAKGCRSIDAIGEIEVEQLKASRSMRLQGSRGRMQ